MVSGGLLLPRQNLSLSRLVKVKNFKTHHNFFSYFGVSYKKNQKNYNLQYKTSSSSVQMFKKLIWTLLNHPIIVLIDCANT